MKKAMVVINICITMALLLSACDPYAGKRPNAYNNTRWVSESPDIYIEISDKYFDVIGCNSYGMINIDSKLTECIVEFWMGTKVYFVDTSSYVPKSESEPASHNSRDKIFFWGEAKFSRDKMVLDVKGDAAGLLPEGVTQITFVREELG